MLVRSFTFFLFCLRIVRVYYKFIIRPQIAKIMIKKICLISYKLELGIQGESVDEQEAIEGSSINQLYDEIWEVYREYAHQCSLFFIKKLDSNHANHIHMYNNELQ